MKKIIIWGAGNRTFNCIKEKLFENCEILAIVDSKPIGKEFMSYPLIKPSEINKIKEFDYIVVNNQYFQEIVIQILELGIKREKIIITDNVKEEPYNTLFEKLKIIFPKIYEFNKMFIKQTVKTNERDSSDKETIYVNQHYSNIEYRNDYFRYRTFEFVAEVIKQRNVEGVLAELGVFRGLFASIINSKFPEKKIYLFDTFEGFDEDEAKKELEKGNCDLNFIKDHKNTSIEMMLNNIPYPDKAVICKGFFPSSIPEEAKNEKFAFVSLDVDFEESTFEGLKFFYPRLSDGGYIFIHDYNTYFLDGVKNAVKRYEKYLNEKLKIVPIADRAGTLIIVK